MPGVVWICADLWYQGGWDERAAGQVGFQQEGPEVDGSMKGPCETNPLYDIWKYDAIAS